MIGKTFYAALFVAAFAGAAGSARASEQGSGEWTLILFIDGGYAAASASLSMDSMSACQYAARELVISKRGDAFKGKIAHCVNSKTGQTQTFRED